MILPLRVFGRPDAMWITSGAAKRADHVAHLLLEGALQLLAVEPGVL